MGANIHVVQFEGQWSIEAEGEGDIGRSFPTKRDAISAARDLAEQNRSELFVHGENGEILDRSSFGNDPRGRG